MIYLRLDPNMFGGFLIVIRTNAAVEVTEKWMSLTSVKSLTVKILLSFYNSVKFVKIIIRLVLVDFVADKSHMRTPPVSTGALNQQLIDSAYSTSRSRISSGTSLPKLRSNACLESTIFISLCVITGFSNF